MDKEEQNPIQISDNNFVPAVFGFLEIPKTPGPHPVVIILYGSAGWRSSYISLAKSYSDSGFVSLVPDYFELTGKGNSQSASSDSFHKTIAFLRRLLIN